MCKQNIGFFFHANVCHRIHSNGTRIIMTNRDNIFDYHAIVNLLFKKNKYINLLLTTLPKMAIFIQ